MKEKQHYQQIDVLKGLAIVAVIALHTFTKATLIQTYAVYHIWQAVPVFLVLMGYNLGLSGAGRPVSFNHLYSRSYFQKKGSRILQPFVIIFIVALLLGLLWLLLFDRNIYTFGWYTLVGVLPVSGKGNYFITMLLQSVLLLPLVSYGFKKKPLLTGLVLLLLEISFLLLSKNIAFFDKDNYLYDAALPRYFSAIALGLWLSKITQHTSIKQMQLLLLMAAASIVYLYLVQYKGYYISYFRREWQLQNFLGFPYAALLIFTVIKLFPQQSNNILLRSIAELGKASYHIFLVQVLYFGLFPQEDSLLQNQLLCLTLGYLFFRIELPLIGLVNKPKVSADAGKTV
ncbi:acyltransferase family protein [Pontibacter ruber]|uniref:Acyltransferase n=1 Tax=Pontibacter ruber TaxID=1343895 RepID=A0ABW5CS52_9BACT|nr:acyltransferase [Pontibacter ruber]